MSSQALRKNVMAALLGSLSFVVMFAMQGISILPNAPFLKYEPSGVFILLAVVMLGPWHGVMACLVKDAMFLLVGAGNIFGVTSDFLNTACFALVAGVLARRSSSLQTRMLAYLCGMAASTLLMIPVNLVVLWLEFGTSPEAVMAMMLPAIIPFNLLKGGLNAGLYQLLGQPVTRAVNRRVV